MRNRFRISVFAIFLATASMAASAPAGAVALESPGPNAVQPVGDPCYRPVDLPSWLFCLLTRIPIPVGLSSS
ncbi:hypothetical protein HLB23_38740 [Nocardia uniformis]|uniref:Secreted protein n=1 Tax=Nocardia uniformis TaxID=53432 RepID=A0A849CAS8_9NOCA|nr:hypothetical protein [Nocardia uniformis]NNH75724.1 hypothetical protein [Nocardia uniformis]